MDSIPTPVLLISVALIGIVGVIITLRKKKPEEN
jgi:hypothetical protein